MPSADEFGLFRLPLTLNKGHVDVKVAKRLFATTERYLNRFKESRTEHYANWNLLGMLAFRLGNFEEALQYLDKVLSPGNDPDNLNALANRKYISEKLYLFTEARDCEQKIARLLGQSDTKEGKRRLRKLRARSVSEQAFAFTNEIFEESVTTERYRKSFDLYQAAIELAGEDVTQSEREDWLFESGLACKTIYGRIKSDKSKKDEVKKFYQDAVNNFITIVQFSVDTNRKSRAWSYLGDLFYQPKELLPPIPETYRDFVDVPNDCFEEALSLSPDDPFVLNRQATQFSKTDKKKALSVIHKSITMDHSESNLKAYHVRANINLSLYKQQLKDLPKSRTPWARRPDNTLLTQAKEDLSLAIKDVSLPWYKEAMAEALYYTATDCDERLKPGSKDVMQQALMYCAKVVESADGSKRSEVHELRGKCLCAMGEHHAALGSYKRALECKITPSHPKGSGIALVSEYEHILPKDHAALREDLHLLRDMEYWLHKVACDYLSSKSKGTLRQLTALKKRRNHHWRIFVKYCEDNSYERELEVIESAATDRRDPLRLQHPLPSSHDRDVPSTSEQGKNQGPPSASTVGDVASSVGDASSQYHDHQHEGQPHAQRQLALPVSVEEGSVSQSVTRRQQSLQTNSSYDQVSSGAQREQLSDEKEDKIDVEYMRKSLSEVQLDETAAASDTVQVTYKYNVKTGKIEDYSIIPSSSGESSAENAHSLLEELEETGGLRGCVKDRDFPLGKPALLTNSESIKNSACTIVVVTKDLELDSVCSHAMLVAVQHGGLVIPVLKEARDIPVLLTPYTHFDATGVVNWTRLERSIEQQIKPEA